MSLNSSEAAWWLLCLGAACSLQIPDQAWTPGLLPPENIKSLVFEILSFLLFKNHKNKRTQGQGKWVYKQALPIPNLPLARPPLHSSTHSSMRWV